MPGFLRVLILALLSAVALTLYLQWTADRYSGPLLSDLRQVPIQSQGQPGTAGNLLGIEVRLMPADYQDRDRLQLRFAAYLDQARNAGLLTPNTIVVLPEHVGTGLFALGEKPEVQQARTLRDAMHWMALSNPWRYLQALLANQGSDRRTEAVLRMKAAQMADAYQTIFGGLARNYGVTLVAGSIVLPEPQLRAGRLRVGRGPLRQVSLAFDAQGRPFGPLWYKHALSRYEQRYSRAPRQASTALLDTPAGPLRVLLGCDGLRGEWLQGNGDWLLAVPGGADPGRCSPSAGESASGPYARMEVGTLGLPWNLLGSPRRPDSRGHGTPAQLKNLWLADPP